MAINPGLSGVPLRALDGIEGPTAGSPAKFPSGFQGSFVPFQLTDSDATLTASDSLVVMTPTANRVLTLPNSVPSASFSVTVVNRSPTFSISLNASGGGTVTSVGQGQVTVLSNNTAPTTTSHWSVTVENSILQSGNSFGAGISIGSNDNFALNFKTNNIIRGSFLASGLFSVSNGLSVTGGNTDIDNGADSRVRLYNSAVQIGQLQATSSEMRVASIGSGIPLHFHTNGSSSGNITAGAWTIGPASDAPYTSFHTTNKSIFASTPSDTTSANGSFYIGTNSYTGANRQPTRLTGLTGASIGFINGNTDTTDVIVFRTNQQADSATALSDVVGTIKASGEWTFGPAAFTGRHIIRGGVDLGTVSTVGEYAVTFRPDDAANNVFHIKNTGPALEFLTGVNAYASGTVRGSITGPGAWTLGTVTNTPQAGFHTIYRNLQTGTPSVASELNGSFCLGANNYNAGSQQPTRITGLTGVRVGLQPRTSNSTATFAIAMNEIADIATTVNNNVLEITAAGAATIGPPVVAATNGVLHRIRTGDQGALLSFAAAAAGILQIGNAAASVAAPSLLGVTNDENIYGLGLFSATRNTNSDCDMLFSVRNNGNADFPVPSLGTPAFQFRRFGTNLLTIHRDGAATIGVSGFNGHHLFLGSIRMASSVGASATVGKSGNVYFYSFVEMGNSVAFFRLSPSNNGSRTTARITMTRRDNTADVAIYIVQARNVAGTTSGTVNVISGAMALSGAASGIDYTISTPASGTPFDILVEVFGLGGGSHTAL